jgi:hypothetical protein
LLDDCDRNPRLQFFNLVIAILAGNPYRDAGVIYLYHGQDCGCTNLDFRPTFQPLDRLA